MANEGQTGSGFNDVDGYSTEESSDCEDDSE